MLDNHIYNLMAQLTQEHKSLWRIKKHYSKDAKGCNTCKKFFAKMKKDKENHIKDILGLIKKHHGELK